MPDSPSLRELQSTLISFLRDGNTSAVSLVAEQPPLSPQQRLSIYSSAYRIRLTEVLELDHEMLHGYLGDENFYALANAYIEKCPSNRTSLRDFGKQLPAYLAEHEPYKSLPALTQLARFERLMLDVFDAPDSERCARADLQAIAPENWPNLQLRFHPSVQTFHDHSLAVRIWQAMKNEQTPPDTDGKFESVDWLLWRGTNRLSQFRAMDTTEYTLLNRAQHGDSFATLCESQLTKLPEAEISAVVLNYLLDWLDQGLIQHLQY